MTVWIVPCLCGPERHGILSERMEGGHDGN